QLSEWGSYEVRQIEGRLFKNALRVTHRLEALRPVVGAHTTRTNATERQVILGIVQVGFVDGDTTGSRSLQHQITSRTLGAEEIKCQRTRSGIDVVDRLLNFPVWDDRQ